MKLFYVNDIQNSLGVIAPAGSTIVLTLSANATTGTVILAQAPITIPLDNTGSCSQLIWFNDEMAPSGLYYSVQVVVPNYGAVWSQNIQITGPNFNLSAWVP